MSLKELFKTMTSLCVHEQVYQERKFRPCIGRGRYSLGKRTSCGQMLLISQSNDTKHIFFNHNHFFVICCYFVYLFSLKSSPPEIAGSNSLGSSHLACSQKDRLEDEERILILLLLLGDPLLYTMTTACRKRWFLPIAQKDGKEQREGGYMTMMDQQQLYSFLIVPPK